MGHVLFEMDRGQWIEHLQSMQEALGLIPSTARWCMPVIPAHTCRQESQGIQGHPQLSGALRLVSLSYSKPCLRMEKGKKRRYRKCIYPL